ncbi:putative transcriptional regulator [Pedobacter cryoconitis]|uniref:Putative transcriptional regulator n=1 Tax=Pedobacter cryoconitis TaxID=188932 RepID=A0A7W8ZLQ3_9SPHI|nr:BlaI/MecI/CopY family transcriptional regulator [Pedobacter cryoconitis]MBB5636311.1 putative transcriptional regulator [Pedobacter cryoconitis]MBB6272772.1 putative transcriptional regulator [Pedobacter cryoconitis]
MSSEITTKPTESELEILQILWEKGNCTVREVHEILTLNREAGYTTTLKIMQIMHEKGLVKRDTNQKTHIYSALASQQKTQQHLVSKLIDNAFSGSAARLVMQALGNHTSSKDEIEAIRKYLNELDHQ